MIPDQPTQTDAANAELYTNRLEDDPVLLSGLRMVIYGIGIAAATDSITVLSMPWRSQVMLMSYYARLRRLRTRPARPRPSNARVPGSGTKPSETLNSARSCSVLQTLSQSIFSNWASGLQASR